MKREQHDTSALSGFWRYMTGNLEMRICLVLRCTWFQSQFSENDSELVIGDLLVIVSCSCLALMSKYNLVSGLQIKSSNARLSQSETENKFVSWWPRWYSLNPTAMQIPASRGNLSVMQLKILSTLRRRKGNSSPVSSSAQVSLTMWNGVTTVIRAPTSSPFLLQYFQTAEGPI